MCTTFARDWFGLLCGWSLGCSFLSPLKQQGSTAVPLLFAYMGPLQYILSKATTEVVGTAVILLLDRPVVCLFGCLLFLSPLAHRQDLTQSHKHAQ